MLVYHPPTDEEVTSHLLLPLSFSPFPPPPFSSRSRFLLGTSCLPVLLLLVFASSLELLLVTLGQVVAATDKKREVSILQRTKQFDVMLLLLLPLPLPLPLCSRQTSFDAGSTRGPQAAMDKDSDGRGADQANR